MRGKVATAIAAGALLAIAGCGDDAPITSISTDASTTSTTEATSDADFVTEADSACAEANAAVANGDLSPGQEAEITQGLLDDLQALDPPEDPSGALDRFFSALGDEVTALEDQEAAAASGSTAETTDLDQARSNAAAAASEYGFEDCGQEGTELPATSSGSSTTTPSVAPSGTTPAPTATTPAAPVEPVEPAPAPVTPPAPTGGTGTGGAPPAGGTGSTGSTGGTGGVGPG